MRSRIPRRPTDVAASPGAAALAATTAVVAIVAGLALLSAAAAAHVGGLSDAGGTGGIPTWLTILTGGVVVGVSFLFSSLMTDHEAIRNVNGRRLLLPAPATLRTAAGWAIRGVGVAVLLLVVVTGFVGPTAEGQNFALLVVWAGWWAGYTMSVYLVGNSWPALNPWRTLADLLPTPGDRAVPERLGAWPSVAALLGLVWLEVVSPVGSEPRLLATVVVGYTVVTLAGAALYGPDTWFGTVDPIARVFRWYGRMAPVQRTDDGLSLRLPSTALAERTDAERTDEVAFVVALLWVTTFDGLVSTPLWAAAAGPVVEAGVPPRLVYAAAIVVGFAAFLAAYRAAARYCRRLTGTYVTPEYVRGWFVPSLLPIAAGYHLAHFLGFLVSLSPVLVGVVQQPFAAHVGGHPLALPGWYPTLQVTFVLVGHVMAVWIAHALAFELFPGKFKPIRSQYPFVAVMIAYTMTSVWIVTQPFGPPPYL
jgi:hypothetical protein